MRVSTALVSEKYGLDPLRPIQDLSLLETAFFEVNTAHSMEVIYSNANSN